MKTSIKLTALFLLATTGLFAATPSTIKSSAAPAKQDVVSFSDLRGDDGLVISVEKNAPGKALVVIKDDDRNVLYKDVLSAGKSFEKGYVLNKLEDGDYTLEVTTSNQVVTKNIHVYDEDGKRMFFVQQ